MITRIETQEIFTAEANIALRELSITENEEFRPVVEEEVTIFISSLAPSIGLCVLNTMKKNGTRNCTAIQTLGWSFSFTEYPRSEIVKHAMHSSGLPDSVCESMLSKLDEILSAQGEVDGRVELEGFGVFSIDETGHILTLAGRFVV